MTELVKLQVVSLSPSAAGATSYILFLQADNGNHLGFPMVIGLTEAQSISMYMENIVPARPLTHDLFTNYIRESNATISYIEISSFQDGVFFAKIYIKGPLGDIILDARPSDSIALGLRLNADIRISESLLNEIAIPMDMMESDEEDPNEFVEKPLSTQVAELEILLEKALLEENYEEAAKLRDQLTQLTK